MSTGRKPTHGRAGSGSGAWPGARAEAPAEVQAAAAPAAPDQAAPDQAAPGPTAQGPTTPGQATPGRATPGPATPGPATPGPTTPGPATQPLASGRAARGTGERRAAGRVQRSSYHHGDLTNALTEAGIQLARSGGPEAVVLREAARQVGVSATAAYRHFANHGELMHALKEHCQGTLAEWMRRELAAGQPVDDPAEDAIRRLLAIGTGYVRFALAEPGLFRTAFCHTPSAPDAAAPGTVAPGTVAPDLAELDAFPSYQILIRTLDELVALGRMPAHRRAYAPIHAWSTAHGLALLLLDGPLAMLPEAAREHAIQGTLQLVVEAVTAPD